MRKTVFCVLMMTLLLTACTARGGKGELTAEEVALQIRTEYLAAPSCAGSAVITADYGLRIYDFTLDFVWRREGETTLTVTEPEELKGLTAIVGAGESRLEFQGVSLGTGDLTGEGLTPLEYLPAVMAYIGDGYMAECVFETVGERETLRVLFRDPEHKPQEGLECSLWFDKTTHMLLRAELSQDGQSVLHSGFVTFTLGEDTNELAEDEDLDGDQSGESGT